MYDHVRFECECPQCKTMLNGFQSKDGSCGLYTLDFWDTNNFYTICDSCGLFIDFNIVVRPDRKIVIEDYKVEVSKNFMNLKEAQDYFKNPIKEHIRIKAEHIKELVIDLKGDDVTEKIIEKWVERNFDGKENEDG